MDAKTNNRLKTGTFVILTTLLFILALYKLGSKRSMFGSAVKITAVFRNVNGLTAGNNVRFGGIDIGTVSKVAIVADTAVEAELSIEKNSVGFLTSTAIASIGTDGLMGNKIVNIIPGKSGGKKLTEGASLGVLPLVELDNAIRTLNQTNDNLEQITDDIKVITNRFSNKNTLWSLLMDTAIADNVKQALVNIRLSGKNAVQFTQGLNEMMSNVNNGKGSLGLLIRDTSLSGNIHRAAMDIRLSSRQAAQMTGNLNSLSAKLNGNQGSIGVLADDTSLVRRVDQAVIDFKSGAYNFSQSMEALKHNILFRRYFREKERKEKEKNTTK